MNETTAPASQKAVDIVIESEVVARLKKEKAEATKKLYDMLMANIGFNTIRDFVYKAKLEDNAYHVNIEMKVCEIRHTLNVDVPATNEDGSPSLFSLALQASMNDDHLPEYDLTIETFIEATLGAGTITDTELRGVCISHR